MDYQFSRDYNIYRQLLFQTIMRAKTLGFKRIDFGLTAGFEKRKAGAQVIEKCCYIQTRDNFAMEALEFFKERLTPLVLTQYIPTVLRLARQQHYLLNTNTKTIFETTLTIFTEQVDRIIHSCFGHNILEFAVSH